MDPQQQTPQPIPSQPTAVVPPVQPVNTTAQAPQSVGTTFPFWYFTGVTTLSATKGIVTVSPGLLVVSDATTNQEIYRLALTPDIRARATFGFSRITFLGGQNIPMLDKKYLFYFYNPKLSFLSYLFMFGGTSKAKQFIATCKQAAGATV